MLSMMNKDLNKCKEDQENPMTQLCLEKPSSKPKRKKLNSTSRSLRNLKTKSWKGRRSPPRINWWRSLILWRRNIINSTNTFTNLAKRYHPPFQPSLTPSKAWRTWWTDEQNKPLDHKTRKKAWTIPEKKEEDHIGVK